MEFKNAIINKCIVLLGKKISKALLYKADPKMNGNTTQYLRTCEPYALEQFMNSH